MGKTVLIVEDEEIIRKGLVYAIPWSAMDCCVVGEAANGVEGAEQIRKLNPDIVIVDINMPVKDGLEMLRETTGAYHFSAIILSGYSSFDYAKTAVHLGVTEYLLKPINREELQAAVEIAKQRQEMRHAWADRRQEQGELLGLQLIHKTVDEETDQVVRQMLDFIQQHFSEKIVMQDVVGRLNYSETFLKRFKKVTGMTFTEYLNRFRIQKAVEILNDENTSSPEVGYLCGFSTPKYFRDVFRKYVGCTPKEYREAARNHSKWPETQ